MANLELNTLVELIVDSYKENNPRIIYYLYRDMRIEKNTEK